MGSCFEIFTMVDRNGIKFNFLFSVNDMFKNIFRKNYYYFFLPDICWRAGASYVYSLAYVIRKSY